MSNTIHELTKFPGKQIYRFGTKNEMGDGDGFSEEGGIHVLANILHNVVHSNIIEGRNQLRFLEAEHYRNALLSNQDRIWQDFNTPANAFFVSAVFGLGSLLDSMAALCDRMFPDGQQRTVEVNFSKYGFETGKIPGLHLTKLKILDCTFSHMKINQVWNKCKHEMPWLGSLAIDSEGIADIRGNDGKCLFSDFIIPIYELVQDMLSKLALYKGMEFRNLSL